MTANWLDQFQQRLDCYLTWLFCKFFFFVFEQKLTSFLVRNVLNNTLYGPIPDQLYFLRNLSALYVFWQNYSVVYCCCFQRSFSQYAQRHSFYTYRFIDVAWAALHSIQQFYQHVANRAGQPRRAHGSCFAWQQLFRYHSNWTDTADAEYDKSAQ